MWIRVEERLPPIGKPVLAQSHGIIYIAYRSPTDEEHWTICEDRCCSCTGCTGVITSWQELPEFKEK